MYAPLTFFMLPSFIFICSKNLHRTYCLSVHLFIARPAIMDNAQLFAGKVVLDVGTGSGILALWAAQAGATKVSLA